MKSHAPINYGQMLIEVVIAVGIIALVLVGVSDLMTRSLKVISFQKQRDEASTLLQKIQNDYKAQRDVDPEGFYTLVTNATIDPCEAGKPYKCSVVVDRAADGVVISATASWDEGGNTVSISSSQSLFRTVK